MRKWQILIQCTILHSLLPPDTKILRPRIYFKVKIVGIENQYDIYSRTCADVSSVLEVVDFTFSYSPVSGINSIHIIITIASAEGLIVFILGISNAFQNTILPNPAEIFYISFPHLYLEWFKIKWPKHPLS